MIELGDDDVVHAEYEKHRLVTIDLGEDVVVYVDYENNHCLAMKELQENDVVHVNYKEDCPAMIQVDLDAIMSS